MLSSASGLPEAMKKTIASSCSQFLKYFDMFCYSQQKAMLIFDFQYLLKY